MDADALSAVEFPAILDLLAGVTATPHGEELAGSLVPSGDPKEVARRQALTAEAIALLDVSAEPELHGVVDVRADVAHAARGGVLAAGALSRVARTIDGGLRGRAALDEQADAAPLLHELAEAIDEELGALADEIG